MSVNVDYYQMNNNTEHFQLITIPIITAADQQYRNGLDHWILASGRSLWVNNNNGLWLTINNININNTVNNTIINNGSIVE